MFLRANAAAGVVGLTAHRLRGTYASRLAELGVRVKATGFGRVDFDVPTALRELYAANPKALMFGTDLPSTRAPRPYRDDDLLLVVAALGEAGARKVLHDNAVAFYRPGKEG